MNVPIYTADQVETDFLADKRLALIGYGSQGRAHALNLRDSGLDIVVGVRADGNTMDQAREDGIEVTTVDKAIEGADLIALLFPDPSQPAVYNQIIAPTLKAGQTLLVAHGFNLHYNQITPPADIDVIMIAPKGPGNLVRELYEMGQGIPALIAVHQDATGNAKKTGLAYAHGLGSTRAAVVETTIAEETETDLFGEQAIICGGVAALIEAGFDTLVAAGYAPEMAYFECCHEMKLIVDLIHNGGMARMRKFVSDTAKYGDITRGPRVIDDHVKANLAEILREIQDGEFAKEWILEHQANRPVYNALLKKNAAHPIEDIGGQLRQMMSWLS